jgi:hypothetical protein
MRAFAVTYEEKRTRRVQVAAPSADLARAQMVALLHPGCRVVDVRAADEPDVAEGEAQRALTHLLDRPYLSHDGQTQLVADWLDRGTTPDLRDAVNGRLALAGLRLLSEASLAVGSPVSVPTLRLWFGNGPWAGSRLLAVLATVPGARRSNMSFGGVRSRAVILPGWAT